MYCFSIAITVFQVEKDSSQVLKKRSSCIKIVEITDPSQLLQMKATEATLRNMKGNSPIHVYVHANIHSNVPARPLMISAAKGSRTKD